MEERSKDDVSGKGGKEFWDNTREKAGKGQGYQKGHGGMVCPVLALELATVVTPPTFSGNKMK